MIYSATVTQYVPPASADADGNTTPATAIASGRRCAAESPTQEQRHELGAAIADASSVLLVPMAGATRPTPGGRYTVALDKLDTRELLVIHVVDRVHGGQSHYEVFTRVP